MRHMRMPAATCSVEAWRCIVPLQIVPQWLQKNSWRHLNEALKELAKVATSPPQPDLFPMFWKSSFAIAALVAAAQGTSITGCHNHGLDYFCINTDGEEGQVLPAPTGSGPSSYTSCHLHGSETYCMSGSSEVLFEVEGGVTSAPSATGSVDAQTTEVTGCHNHGDNLFCIDGQGNEGMITPAPSASAAPESFTGCHQHDTETFCLDSSGNEYQFVAEEATEGGEDDEEMDCHYHAGVPHCVPKSGGSSSHSASATECVVPDNDYDIPLRIGLLFVILVGDFVGVYAPLVVKRWFSNQMDGLLVTLFRQFGVGVVLSTALVHLLTHAQLMFENECLHTAYESTATSIAMAGLFIAFCIEFFLGRWLQHRVSQLKAASGVNGSEEEGRSSEDDFKDQKGVVSGEGHTHEDLHHHHDLDIAAKQDKIAVGLLEAGIIFHSVLIGITLAINPDGTGSGGFITLFIVILFHQIFEGIALGTGIAQLESVSIWTKLLMGAAFAVTTPIGMAIGIGVLNQFNGNDPSTIVALGTLDALSAGVLLWVGLIEMLNHDWLQGGLMKASWIKVSVGFIGLLGGMILMSYLGNWA